ncbi:MAG: hypothetical protein AUH89_01080 [Ktedonobacter sp. 13_1_40CM_4_52_4]|nr:MAG: hypothetical protein AUH89_01080 [Ktedonobacter sp. 13_1_40CM_4_52_4]
MTEKFSQEKKSDLGLLELISTSQGESTPGIKRLNFSDSSQREAHISAFLAWLPKTLQEAPGIDWARLPSRTMGYLMRTAASSPDVIPITLAIGCAMDGMKNNRLYTNASHLTGLLRRLRVQYGLQELSQLKDRHTWEQFIEGRTLSSGEVSVLVAYDTLSSLYLRSFWVKEHFEQLSYSIRSNWRLQLAAYAPENNTYFLQYEGPSCDLYWFGDLIEKRLLGGPPEAVARERKGQPQKRGSNQYLMVKRPGVLSPLRSDSVWLRLSARSGEILFEPETLYRGVLFAAALATLALTNGSRVSELLQVSATRFETLVVDELKNQQPTGRKIAILVQNLLPKGSTQENERQFFLISEMAGRLLTEIGQQLEAAHGGRIPVVQPLRQTKEEDLRPEPYFFQICSGMFWQHMRGKFKKFQLRQWPFSCIIE